MVQVEKPTISIPSLLLFCLAAVINVIFFVHFTWSPPPPPKETHPFSPSWLGWCWSVTIKQSCPHTESISAFLYCMELWGAFFVEAFNKSGAEGKKIRQGKELYLSNCATLTDGICNYVKVINRIYLTTWTHQEKNDVFCLWSNNCSMIFFRLTQIFIYDCWVGYILKLFRLWLLLRLN